MPQSDWHKQRENWQKVVDAYLKILFNLKSIEEIANSLNLDERTVRTHVKRLEKEGFILAYKVNNLGKKAYIRRISWDDL